MAYKGQKLSAETRAKIKANHVGTRGLKFSTEIRRKMSASAKRAGTGQWMTGRRLSEETKRKIGFSSAGRRQSAEARLKYTGNKNPNWRGGITPINAAIRTSPEYKLWRKAVFERDGYACVWCGDESSGNLQADHIKPFALFPELRFAIDNGRTLCEPCHRATDTYGWKTRRSL